MQVTAVTTIPITGGDAASREADLKLRIDRLEAVLRHIKDITAGPRLPNWTEDRWTVTQTRGRIVDIIDLALAPAKHQRKEA